MRALQFTCIKLVRDRAAIHVPDSRTEVGKQAAESLRIHHQVAIVEAQPCRNHRRLFAMDLEWPATPSS